MKNRFASSLQRLRLACALTAIARFLLQSAVGTPLELVPPATFTMNAPVVAPTGVTLSAVVNSQAANTQVSWQYGLVSGSYSSTTSAGLFSLGLTNRLCAKILPKAILSPAVYYSRLVISSTAGTVYGPEQTFSFIPPTLAYSPPVITSTTAALTATVTPNGLPTAAYFEFGTPTTLAPLTAPVSLGDGFSPVALNIPISDLAPASTYRYRVVYSSNLGKFYGQIQLFSTPPLFGTQVLLQTKDPAPGIPNGRFSAIGNPVLNDYDHFAFQATVSGTGRPGADGILLTNNSGIWIDKGADGRFLLVRTGDPAPGYTPATPVGTFGSLSDPVFNNSEAIAFLGTLAVSSTVTTTNRTGIWATTSGTLALVARAGDPAPDANGAVSANSPIFSSFTQFVLPNQGDLILLGNLQLGTASSPGPGGVFPSNYQGVWAMDSNGVLKQLVRTGDSLTISGSLKAISTLSLFNNATLCSGQTRHFNDSGDLLLKVTFRDYSSALIQATFPFTEIRSSGTVLAQMKDPAPGIQGASFYSFSNACLNGSRHVAFKTNIAGSKGSGITLSNNSAIWADVGANGRALIARTGTSAPGATAGSVVGNFSALSDPVYNGSDNVAFVGWLNAYNNGIWATNSGALTLVAKLYDPAPDGSGAVSTRSARFQSFSQLVLPDQAGVIFSANAGGVGIWAVDTNGVLKRALHTGDCFTVNGTIKTISALTLFDAPPFSVGQSRHFNNPGDILYRATFTDGSRAIMRTVFE